MTVVMALKLALVISVFINVFALALRADANDVLYLLRNWRLGLRAALAIYVAVPAAAIAMCLLFEFRPAVEIAMIAVAFSPIPPVLPKKQLKVGGSASYVTGLLVLATALSLVVTPLGVGLAADMMHAEAAIGVRKIAITLLLTVGLPLGCGLLAGYLMKGRTKAFAEGLRKLGTVMLAAALLVWLGLSLPAIWAVIGDGTLLALSVICVVGLAAGHLLGGPAPGDRDALSLAAAARHPGIAVAIATTNFPDEKLAPAAILLSLVLYALVSIPYLRLIDRHEAAASA